MLSAWRVIVGNLGNLPGYGETPMVTSSGRFIMDREVSSQTTKATIPGHTGGTPGGGYS